MNFKTALLAGLLGLAATQVLACYTVYDRTGRIVYNEDAPPVDMTRPLHETLPARFPGGQMVFDAAADCQAITPLAPVNASRPGTPLLTDRRTAEAMHLPYSVLRGAIVMVQPRDVRIGPGVTVVPAEGLTLPQPAGTVITELSNPPVTIVQYPDGLVTRQMSNR